MTTVLVPTRDAAWWGSLLWLAGLTAAALAVAWRSGTPRMPIRRTVLSVGFLVTGGSIAPALGRVFVHAEATLHGTGMPPRQRPAATAEPAEPAHSAPGVRPAAAA